MISCSNFPATTAACANPSNLPTHISSHICLTSLIQSSREKINLRQFCRSISNSKFRPKLGSAINYTLDKLDTAPIDDDDNNGVCVVDCATPSTLHMFRQNQSASTHTDGNFSRRHKIHTPGSPSLSSFRRLAYGGDSVENQPCSRSVICTISHWWR